MDIYAEIKDWVERLGEITVDSCGHGPEAVGLFPQGVQVLRSWEDVTGRKMRKARYNFLLQLVLPPGDLAAGKLLQLQAEAAKKGYAATDGKRKKVASDGLAIYEIRLSAEREEIL